MNVLDIENSIMATKEGFENSFYTAYGFDELLKKHDKKIVESYELEVVENEIYVTEQVNNILFCKR